MSESPGDRFRRITQVWREEEKRRPGSPAALTPDTPGRAAEPARTHQESTQPAPKPQPVKAPTQPAQPEPQSQSAEAPAAEPAPAPLGAAQRADSSIAPVEKPSPEPAPSLDNLRTPADARRFLERLRAKTSQVVQDHASGVINQRQFQAVYSHYQSQRMAIEEALIKMPGSGAWRAAATEGHTIFLRQQHAARVLSYAIYETASGQEIKQAGEVKVDAALLVPVLNSFRSNPKQLFGDGMQQTEIEDGHWLCFVPGQYTTLTVVFSDKPVAIQLKTVEDSHCDFETVNKHSLHHSDFYQLTYTFTHLWASEPGFI